MLTRACMADRVALASLVASVSTMLVVACVGQDPSLPVDATTDAATADAWSTSEASTDDDGSASGPRCDLTKDFDAPSVVPELSMGAQNIAARLTPNELTVFLGQAAGASDPRDLFTATRVSITDPFPMPVTIATLSTGSEEGKPTLTADGQLLYFHRNDVTPTDYRIFMARRDFSGGFMTPTPLGAVVNESTGSPSNNDPFVSPDGNALYFTRRVGGLARLFVAESPTGTGDFGKATAIDTVSSEDHQASPVISADGLSLYYAAGPNAGATQIYVAKRRDMQTPFGAGVMVPNMGAANARTEPSWISPDGCVLYVFSNRDVKFQIYQATRPR